MDMTRRNFVTAASAATVAAMGTSVALAETAPAEGEQAAGDTLEADIVIAALPATPETDHFFGQKEFALMKRSALFINIARASVVDEAALIDALSQKEIAGACMDVFSKEPLPGDHPFWQMDNVIMTPHIASMIPDFWDKLTSLLQMNFVAFARGDKLMNEVDKKKGY